MEYIREYDRNTLLGEVRNAVYNIGEVEKITGISKDRLRYYEEKGILNPKKSEHNSYREFSDEDIIQILSIEYYRSMDLGMKEIKQIREQGEIENLSAILQKKSQEVWKKMQELQDIYQELQEGIDCCEHIQKHLNQFSLHPLPPFKILGELADSKAFSEYTKLHDRKRKQTPIIKSMIREITFLDTEIKSNKMLIVELLHEADKNALPNRGIPVYKQCLYTIVEEKIGGPDIMQQVVHKSELWLQQNHYRHQDVVYVMPLVMTYPLGEAMSYLGIYIPVCREE